MQKFSSYLSGVNTLLTSIATFLVLGFLVFILNNPELVDEFATFWRELIANYFAGYLNAIAVVNKTPIMMESYLRALDRYQNDSKDSLSDDDKSWVLQRLIEEELLVQRGFSLGMITTDNDVRPDK